MKAKKIISAWMVIVLLTSMLVSPTSLTFADTIPNASVDLSTGHAFPLNVVIGPDGKLYVAEYSANKIMQMDKDGSNKVTFATGFNQPIGMVFDASGNLYVSDHTGRSVKKVDTGGNVSLVKDVGSGLLTDITLDSANKLYTIDYQNGAIYKMDLDGSNFTTFVNGLTGSSLIGLDIDSNDNLYLSDRSNNKLLKIAPDGTVSDFAVGITTPTWISLGADGYFYASSGSRKIEKLDQNGTIVTTFDTGSVSPWGAATDLDGYIYYGETSSTVRLFAGYAETLSTNTIKLTMNQQIAGTQLDPAAITITGAATNPQATAVMTSGAVITISLDNAISPQDTAVKVSYSKTGTDNLVIDGTANEFNNFSNVPVKNNTVSVSSVVSIPQIDVANGTLLASIGLPNTVTLNLSDSSTTNVNVTWDNGTPVYNDAVAGTYTFSGTFNVSGNISNPNNIAATVDVVVAEAPIVVTPPTPPIPTLDADPTPIPQGNTSVKINGEAQQIGKEVKSVDNGISRVDVTVVSDTIDKLIDEVINKNLNNPNATKNTVEINVVDTDANLAVVGLTGDILKKLEENDFDVIVKRGALTYSIPASEFTVDAVASRLSVPENQLDTITFEFQTQLLNDATQTMLSKQVTDNKAELLMPATELHLTAKALRVDGTTEVIPLNDFSQYVDRTFELPRGISLTGITTGIVFNDDYTYTHVPTYVFSNNGRNYAQIRSLTNSTYSVIYNPVQVESVKGHWAQSTVDNLASRLVLTNIKDFQADANITRGELADYLVRALGLYRNDHTVSAMFTDVSPQSEHAIAISIASHWGIINGYADGTFRPEADLTREEAMTMYARALAITPYVSSSKEVSDLDLTSASQWAKPFVNAVLESKVFVGRLNNTLDFKAQLTHAEALTAIENLLNVSNLIDNE